MINQDPTARPVYRHGETVDIAIKDAKVQHVFGTSMHVRTPDGTEYTVPFTAEIKRVLPADGVPQPGDLWTDAADREWFATDNAGTRGLKLQPAIGMSRTWPDVNDDHGPLTLARRLSDLARPTQDDHLADYGVNLGAALPHGLKASAVVDGRLILTCICGDPPFSGADHTAVHEAFAGHVEVENLAVLAPDSPDLPADLPPYVTVEVIEQGRDWTRLSVPSVDIGLTATCYVDNGSPPWLAEVPLGKHVVVRLAYEQIGRGPVRAFTDWVEPAADGCSPRWGNDQTEWVIGDNTCVLGQAYNETPADAVVRHNAWLASVLDRPTAGLGPVPAPAAPTLCERCNAEGSDCWIHRKAIGSDDLSPELAARLAVILDEVRGLTGDEGAVDTYVHSLLEYAGIASFDDADMIDTFSLRGIGKVAYVATAGWQRVTPAAAVAVSPERVSMRRASELCIELNEFPSPGAADAHLRSQPEFARVLHEDECGLIFEAALVDGSTITNSASSGWMWSQ